MVSSNDTGGDSTTNNKLGIESYNSIVASIEASTSAVNWRSSCITLSYYYLEFHAFFYIFFILRLSSIWKHGDWWGVFFFFKRETSFSWGRYTILVDVVLWAHDWALFLIFSACPFFYAPCSLNRLLLGCVIYGLRCGYYVD